MSQSRELINEIYEHTGLIFSEFRAKGFQKLIDKKIEESCKELNAPNVEQSGYSTETPKFTGNPGRNETCEHDYVFVGGNSPNLYECCKKCSHLKIIEQPSEKKELCTHDFEYKNLLTICKKCGYCQETFGKYSKGSEKKESETLIHYLKECPCLPKYWSDETPLDDEDYRDLAEYLINVTKKEGKDG